MIWHPTFPGLVMAVFLRGFQLAEPNTQYSGYRAQQKTQPQPSNTICSHGQKPDFFFCLKRTNMHVVR